MAEPIIMPKQGQSVESCIISQWHKKRATRCPKATFCSPMKPIRPALMKNRRWTEFFWKSFEEGDDVPVLTNVA